MAPSVRAKCGSPLRIQPLGATLERADVAWSVLARGPHAGRGQPKRAAHAPTAPHEPPPTTVRRRVPFVPAQHDRPLQPARRHRGLPYAGGGSTAPPASGSTSLQGAGDSQHMPRPSRIGRGGYRPSHRRRRAPRARLHARVYAPPPDSSRARRGANSRRCAILRRMAASPARSPAAW
jgi:hypothetical protein